jgi:hypothetical protein
MEQENKIAVECLCDRKGVGKIPFEKDSTFEYPVAYFDEDKAILIVKSNPKGYRIGIPKGIETTPAPVVKETKPIVRRRRKVKSK